MNRRSGTVSSGKRMGMDASHARLFLPGVTAVISLGLMVSASGSNGNASKSYAAFKPKHALNRVRPPGSQNVTSQFIAPQFQQSGASTQNPAQAPNTPSTTSPNMPSVNRSA